MLLTTVAPGNSIKDWARSPRGYLIAWGIPSLALIAAAWLAPGARALAWSAVLVWMGTGCIMNARRCGRTHCRYTGPYYFAMIVPAVRLGSVTIAAGTWAWWLLGAMILLGSKAIWVATEARWGKYRA